MKERGRNDLEKRVFISASKERPSKQSNWRKNMFHGNSCHRRLTEYSDIKKDNEEHVEGVLLFFHCVLAEMVPRNENEKKNIFPDFSHFLGCSVEERGRRRREDVALSQTDFARNIRGELPLCVWRRTSFGYPSRTVAFLSLSISFDFHLGNFNFLLRSSSITSLSLSSHLISILIFINFLQFPPCGLLRTFACCHHQLDRDVAANHPGGDGDGG